jgi:hypothetical protein
LKQHFYVANVHFNNFTCQDGLAPFPAWAFEALFVNKKIGTRDPSGTPVAPQPLDARNNPGLPDCQEWIR